MTGNQENPLSNQQVLLCQHWRTLINTIPDLIWLKDADGVYLRCNKRFEQFYGAVEADILGKTDYDFVSRELADFFRANDRAAMLEGKSRTNEEWVTYASDGHKELLETTKTPMFDQSGKLIGVLGIGHDITAARKTQEALESSEANFRNLFNGVVETIYVLDEQGVFLDVNAAAERMYGYQREFFIGKTPEYLSAPGKNDLVAHRRIFQNVLAGEEQHFEFWGRRANGEIFPKDVFARLGVYQGKKVVFASAFDISERKKTEKDRDRLQRELQQAYKMEAVGQLTGGIAHDFNNLLAIILGFTELAQETPVAKADAKLGSYLDNVRKAGDRAAAVVSQLLAFVRQEPAKDRPIRLQDLLAVDLNVLRSSIPANIEMVQHVDQDTPKVFFNEIQFQQILMNLCLNARDAISGTGRIEVSLGWARDVRGECAACHKPVRGDWIALSVRDSGAGMEPELLDHIFDPYFTTKSVGKGSGMGLAVIYSIIAQHGGHILLESRPGEGSLFSILFPPLLEQADATSAGGGSDSNKTCAGTRCSVLVVDDEPGLREMIADMLQIHGYQVTTAPSGSQALELMRDPERSFDLLITDQTMPGMSGAELIGQSRRLRPDLPVMLCSGYSEEIADSVKELPKFVFQSKPLVFSDFLSAVAKLTGKPG